MEAYSKLDKKMVCMCIYWLKSQASLEAEISLIRITLMWLESFKLIILKIKINNK